MKTEDIIKALKCCKDRKCNECVRLHSGHNEECVCRLELLDFTLDLVCRLYKELNEVAKEQYVNGRIDGVKAFVEKLKSKDGNEFIIFWTESMDVCFEFDNESYENFINSIVKEINLLEEITKN